MFSSASSSLRFVFTAAAFLTVLLLPWSSTPAPVDVSPYHRLPVGGPPIEPVGCIDRSAPDCADVRRTFDAFRVKDCTVQGVTYPAQASDPTTYCYVGPPPPVACGTPSRPWQTTNSSAGCFLSPGCGTPSSPWQNTNSTAACYVPPYTTPVPCGSSSRPWQDTNPSGACYYQINPSNCGSASNPWQNTDPAADCYQMPPVHCGEPGRPWQSTNSSAPCYRPLACGAAGRPWQTTNSAGDCYRPPECGEPGRPFQDTNPFWRLLQQRLRSFELWRSRSFLAER